MGTVRMSYPDRYTFDFSISKQLRSHPLSWPRQDPKQHRLESIGTDCNPTVDLPHLLAEDCHGHDVAAVPLAMEAQELVPHRQAIRLGDKQ
jgi:hypothetical protein